MVRRYREHDEDPVYVLHYVTEREDDGRYIAAIPGLPGVMAYGVTEEQAIKAAAALARRVLDERAEEGEPILQQLLAHQTHHDA